MLSKTEYLEDKIALVRPDGTAEEMDVLDLQGRAVRGMEIKLRGTRLDQQTQLNLWDTTTTIYVGSEQVQN